MPSRRIPDAILSVKAEEEEKQHHQSHLFHFFRYHLKLG
jgi:hypothetical protein